VSYCSGLFYCPKCGYVWQRAINGGGVDRLARDWPMKSSLRHRACGLCDEVKPEHEVVRLNNERAKQLILKMARAGVPISRITARLNEERLVSLSQRPFTNAVVAARIRRFRRMGEL